MQRKIDMRKFLKLGLLVGAFLAPAALAEPSDTLRTVVAKDAVITAQGFNIPIDYHDDGTYSGEANGSSFTGSWRIEDTRLCTRSSMSPGETCTEYPVGMKAGDVFEVTSPTLGLITVRINH